MTDPISNVHNVLREAVAAQNRTQSSPLSPPPGAKDPVTSLAPDSRIEALQSAVEKLIKKSLPAHSKLQIEQDKETGMYIYRSIDPDTGEVISQYPQENLVKMREYLREMEGMLVDKSV